MTKLAIQVLLYPHKTTVGKDFQQFSWHTPAQVRIRLKGPSNVTLETSSDGVARRSLKPGKYLLSLTNLPGFSLGSKTITVPKSGTKRQSLQVVPNGGKWLVPLRLAFTPASTGIPAGVGGAAVQIVGPGTSSRSFASLPDGNVYATGAAGEVRAIPARVANIEPAQPDFVVRTDQEQDPVDVEYRLSEARITIRPEVRPFGPQNAIPGVTFELSRDDQEVPLRQVTRGSQACVFSDLPPGQVTVRIIPPASHEGCPITLIGGKDQVPVNLAAGDDVDLSSYFRFEYPTGTLRGRIVDGDGQPVAGIDLVASSNGLTAKATSNAKGKYSLPKIRIGEWTIMPDQSAVQRGSLTLISEPDQQVIRVQEDKTAKAADFTLEPADHGIRGNVTDAAGKPFPYAIVEIRDQRMNVIDTVVADEHGHYSWQSSSSGMFVVSLLRQDGETVQRQLVTVNSWTDWDLQALDLLPPPGGNGPLPPPHPRSLPRLQASPPPSSPPQPPPSLPREAFTDLAAYPVLTEEITTTGVPAPADGGQGGGYGQAVEQAMRDVLGWRPSSDAAGFQEALTGAFKLSEVEGHTEWTWQQRGYAVQADMGALTGAQASIYARARNALDQILPLLAGLTSIDPSRFPPQDLEAIRSVVTSELNELVDELSVEGGPRIQRVNDFFRLLVGATDGPATDPDLIQGQLGTLRDRFALTAAEVNTLDEDRVVTNFRVIVEQVLALRTSWINDRKLLTRNSPQISLGTTLILLSRSLEAVAESVDDLNFALDSVFVDAAQRQVIEIPFANEPPMLLSELLDWVVQATRVDGPRLIQDAGKDGVFAFAPVLRRLRNLVRQTRELAQDHSLPAGMRTPRVTRSLAVVSKQLTDATGLAAAVRSEPAPVISAAWLQLASGTTPAASPDQPPFFTTGTVGGNQAVLHLLGSDFRPGAEVAVTAQGRPDLDQPPLSPDLIQPSLALAYIANPPWSVPSRQQVTWLVSLTNSDGTRSNEVELLGPPTAPAS